MGHQNMDHQATGHQNTGHQTMDHQATNVLLIEDNPGDADLVRLRLVEGQI